MARTKHDFEKTPAALTKDAKAMIQLAFQDLGGLPRLVEWANHPANTGTFYTQIWSKIIPKETKAEIGGPNGKPIQIEALAAKRLQNLGDDEISTLEEILTKITDADFEEGEVVELLPNHQ